MKHPKTIKYNGRRYKVAFITDEQVIISFPENEIYGFHSRLAIPKPKRWLKYRA